MTFSRPPTAQEAVLVELRRLIATGALPPGTPIRQDAIAEQLNVSRVPVREALKILEGEGQVAYAAHRGYSVTELSAADLAEAYRLRQLLESEAIAVAVSRLTDAELARIQAASVATDRALRTTDMDRITATNRDFHFAIYEASHQPRLVRLIRQLWDATEVYRAVYFQSGAHRKLIIKEHAAMLAALERRDAPAAITAHDEHRGNAVRGLGLS